VHCVIASLCLSVFVGFSPALASTVLLGDISYQPGDPITGLTDIVLDNFTDVPDLGCSSVYAACGGLVISGDLQFDYTDSMGNSQVALIPVSPTDPGSTTIYEFDPTQIAFDSAILTGTILPTSFLVADGNTFNSGGSFTSDTLTADNGFANISLTGSETSAVPEARHCGLFVVLLTLGAGFLRWRSTEIAKQ
jgi:hypothetical protein